MQTRVVKQWLVVRGKENVVRPGFSMREALPLSSENQRCSSAFVSMP